MNRLNLASVLVLVVVLACGLAAMRDGSDEATLAFVAATWIVLFVALLGAIVRPDPAPWRGFALFGWGYILLAFLPIPWETGSRASVTLLPMKDLVRNVARDLHPLPTLQEPAFARNYLVGTRPDGTHVLTTTKL